MLMGDGVNSRMMTLNQLIVEMYNVAAFLTPITPFPRKEDVGRTVPCPSDQ